jgi:hypothetical protein
MKFYGEVDKNEKGTNSSEYPAWYLETHLDELNESMSRRERGIKRGDIPVDSIPYERQELAKEKARFDSIMNSKPKLGDKEKDFLNKNYKDLSRKIQASMFTRSDMMFGTASAHEEARRMVEPVIELTKEQLELAVDIEVKVVGEKTSRNGASKLFKLIGKLLGEPTNIEWLRKDKVTSAGRPKQTVAA